ncbi:MAG: flagellar hook assembly protein FlgD [Roseateles sp.]|nr:MAG: flagellar hook assembly protein FlgD [Roseateles sp.]
MDFSVLNQTSTSGASGSSSSSTKTAAQNAQDTQDRFLKLLVAQMNNQDPLNPMDNAQVTSQMAQIQQVTALSGLDTSIKGLGGQLGQLQALQSISLVGRDVSVPGDKLMVADGQTSASYSLDAKASNVKLEILGPGGGVIDTVQLGAQNAGRQSFTWDAANKVSDGTQLSYRITATNGSTAVTSTTYMHDKVDSVFSLDGTLKLQLERLGTVDYTSVAAVD